jgi:putative nucleotidyltransferase with HDIG domain
LVEIKLEQLYKGVFSSPIPTDSEWMVVTPDGRILLHHDSTLLGRKIQELPEYKDFNFSLGADRSSQKNMFTFQNNDTWVHAYHHASSDSGYVYYELLHGEAIADQLLFLHLMFIGISLLILTVGIYAIYLFWRWNKGSPITRRSNVLSLAKLEEERVPPTELDQIVRSFYLAVEMKDLYTADHSERVARYALAIYDQMGEEQKHLLPRDDLWYAGLLHDIGKVGIPDRILLKEGRLTKEEYEQIKLHSTIGADMVEQIESLAHVSPGVRYHHERWDGHGYPEQLKGEEIPLIGRILAVADTFDAMISTRTYQQAVSAKKAYEEILCCSHTQFDPHVVSFFQQAYENGSLQVRNIDSEQP